MIASKAGPTQQEAAGVVNALPTPTPDRRDSITGNSPGKRVVRSEVPGSSPTPFSISTNPSEEPDGNEYLGDDKTNPFYTPPPTSANDAEVERSVTLAGEAVLEQATASSTGEVLGPAETTGEDENGEGELVGLLNKHVGLLTKNTKRALFSPKAKARATIFSKLFKEKGSVIRWKRDPSGRKHFVSIRPFKTTEERIKFLEQLVKLIPAPKEIADKNNSTETPDDFIDGVNKYIRSSVSANHHLIYKDDKPVIEEIAPPVLGEISKWSEGVKKILELVNDRYAMKQNNKLSANVVERPLKRNLFITSVNRLFKGEDCASFIRYNPNNPLRPWSLGRNVTQDEVAIFMNVVDILTAGIHNQTDKAWFENQKTALADQYFQGTAYLENRKRGQIGALKHIVGKVEGLIFTNIKNHPNVASLCRAIPLSPPVEILVQGEEAVKEWFKEITNNPETKKLIEELIHKERIRRKDKDKIDTEKHKLQQKIAGTNVGVQEKKSVVGGIKETLHGIFSERNAPSKKDPVGNYRDRVDGLFDKAHRGFDEIVYSIERSEDQGNSLSSQWTKQKGIAAASFNKMDTAEVGKFVHPYESTVYHTRVVTYLDKIAKEVFNDELTKCACEVSGQVTEIISTSMQLYNQEVNNFPGKPIAEIATTLDALEDTFQAVYEASERFQKSLADSLVPRLRKANEHESTPTQTLPADDALKRLQDTIRSKIIDGRMHLADQYVSAIGKIASEQDKKRVAETVVDPYITEAKSVQEQVESMYEAWKKRVEGLKQKFNIPPEEIHQTIASKKASFKVAATQRFQQIQGFQSTKIGFSLGIKNFFQILKTELKRAASLVAVAALPVGALLTVVGVAGVATLGIGIALAGGAIFLTGLGYIVYRLYTHYSESQAVKQREKEIRKFYKETMDYLDGKNNRPSVGT